MDTKLKGDIAEQTVITECLKRGYDVLTPIGDRLPYDLVIVNDSKFIRIQVKSAWLNKKSKNYSIDSRKARTNRKKCSHIKYGNNDFEFVIAYIQDLNLFYILPIKIYNSYVGTIDFVVEEKRQRKPKSDIYKEAWVLIDNF